MHLVKVMRNLAHFVTTSAGQPLRGTRARLRDWALTFFDVRITNPNAPSNQKLSFAAVYKRNEAEKMKAYGDRILQVEKGSFVPLVYTTSGGMAPNVREHTNELLN